MIWFFFEWESPNTIITDASGRCPVCPDSRGTAFPCMRNDGPSSEIRLRRPVSLFLPCRKEAKTCFRISHGAPEYSPRANYSEGGWGSGGRVRPKNQQWRYSLPCFSHSWKNPWCNFIALWNTGCVRVRKNPWKGLSPSISPTAIPSGIWGFSNHLFLPSIYIAAFLYFYPIYYYLR